jgi:hypothetical protein
LHLTNTDFDTGKDTHAGEYALTDDAYAHLLNQLAKDKFSLLTPELKQDILNFYKDLNAPIATKRNGDDWKKTLEELDLLKEQQPATPSATADPPTDSASDERPLSS